MFTRSKVVAPLCYAFVVCAWIVDLLTPQPFVAAILLNVPIALSSLALNARLTASLVILAELANAGAGYFNGVQSGYHWDSIAIGNRALSAVSFLLVGYLTTAAQQFAVEAGRSQERLRVLSLERRLRRAVDTVRETLIPDVVRRSTVREAAILLDAREALLIRQDHPASDPQTYTSLPDLGMVQDERRPLETGLEPVFRGANEDEIVILQPHGDAGVILKRHHALCALAVHMHAPSEKLMLIVFLERPPDDETTGVFESFAHGADVALAQASLFQQVSPRDS